jgi:hypothetical protein
MKRREFLTLLSGATFTLLASPSLAIAAAAEHGEWRWTGWTQIANQLGEYGKWYKVVGQRVYMIPAVLSDADVHLFCYRHSVSPDRAREVLRDQLKAAGREAAEDLEATGFEDVPQATLDVDEDDLPA